MTFHVTRGHRRKSELLAATLRRWPDTPSRAVRAEEATRNRRIGSQSLPNFEPRQQGACGTSESAKTMMTEHPNIILMLADVRHDTDTLVRVTSRVGR